MIEERKAALRADIDTITMPEVDLARLLDSVQEFPARRGLVEVCPLDDCGCSGRAHD